MYVHLGCMDGTRLMYNVKYDSDDGRMWLYHTVTCPPTQAEIRPIADFTCGTLIRREKPSAANFKLYLCSKMLHQILFAALVLALFPCSMHASLGQTGELTYVSYLFHKPSSQVTP